MVGNVSKIHEIGPAHFAAMILSSDDAIIGKTLDGVVTSWNPGAETLYGFQSGEMIGRSIQVLIPPEKLREEETILAQIGKGKKVDHYDTIRRHKDGRDIDISVTVSPIRDHDGTIIGASQIARDISDRKTAANALQRHLAEQAKYRAIFDTALDAIIVIDEWGAIQAFNGSAERYFGHSADAVFGQNVKILMPPADSDRHDGYLRAYRTTGIASIIGVGREVEGQRKDGSRFPIHVSIAEWHNGAQHYFTAIIRDITEQRRVEQELRKTTDLLKATFDAAPFPIVVVAPDTTIIMGNAAVEQVLGDSPDKLIGMDVLKLLQPADHDAARKALEAAVAAKAQQAIATRHRSKDGHIIETNIRIGPVVDPELGVQGTIMILEDITEKNAIEAQLRQSQKMEAIGQLTGGVAHDFNNLLAVVQGNIELIAEEIGDMPNIAGMLGDVFAAIQRGAGLTRHLLAYSRQQPLEPHVVAPAGHVSNLTKLLQRTLAETIEIQEIAPPELWDVCIDQQQLENALLNLALNARDAMPSGGKLTFELENATLDEDYAEENSEVVAGDYVCLAISDTGDGMTKETLARACDPFFTTKGVGSGTGLGLSMVYGFMKQSGGHLKIYSELGSGTTVRLYLPRALTKEIPVSTPHVVSPLAIGNELIFVVEDDPAIRRLAIKLLNALGYRTIDAEDGPSALRLLEETGTVDLLFTDIVLPNGMSGVAVADAFRARSPELKVLYMSGYARNAIVHNGVVDDGVHILTKPFPKSTLAQKIREVLDEAKLSFL